MKQLRPLEISDYLYLDDENLTKNREYMIRALDNIPTGLLAGRIKI
jgi:hypothetical protein